MPSVMHLLQPGTTCEDQYCPAEHVKLRHKQVVSLHGTTWRTAEGDVMDVSEVTPRHALNIYLYLHRTAWRRAWSEIMGDIASPFAPSGEMACDAVEQIHDEMIQHPHRWLDETTLVRALWRRVLDGLPSAR